MAEASSIMLLIPRRFAPLLGGDPQFVGSDPQQHFVPGIDPERPTEGSWDDKTPILAHTETSLFHHGTLQVY